MSRLSAWLHFHDKNVFVTSMVSYLETIDVPGPAKKAIATTILTLLHLSAGKWSDLASGEISNVIDLTLAKIRATAAGFAHKAGSAPAPIEPPAPVPNPVFDPTSEVYDSRPSKLDGYDIYRHSDNLYSYWPHGVDPVPAGWILMGSPASGSGAPPAPVDVPPGPPAPDPLTQVSHDPLPALAGYKVYQRADSLYVYYPNGVSGVPADWTLVG